MKEIPTVDQFRVRQEQLQLLAGSFPTSALATLVNGTIICFLQWQVIDHTNITSWFICLLAISLVRTIQYHQFRQASDKSVENSLQFWERSFMSGNILSGILWGSSAFLLFPENNMNHQALLIFVLAGMSAGAVANLSHQFKSAVSFLLLALLPITSQFLLMDSEIGYSMGFMSVFFLIILITTAKRLHNNTFQNISLRLASTQREKALEQSQHELALHIQQSPIAIIDWNRDLEVTQWNPSAERIFGYSSDEAMGKTIIELVTPKDRIEQTINQCNEVLNQEESISTTLENITKSGQKIFCEWNCSLVKDNDISLGITSMVSDITERKLAQERLITSEKRFRTLLDNTPDAILLHDKHGNIIDANEQACVSLGYHYDEILNLNVSQIDKDITPDDDQGIWERLPLNEKTSVEGINIRKDGSSFPVEVNLTAIDNNGHKLILAAVRDITQRKQMEQMKNNFVSTVSHELRTPLTSIRGALGLVAGGATGKIPKKSQSLLDIAGNNVDRLLRLINDLLDMQKIEAGKMEFSFGKFSIKKLIEHAIAENTPYGRQFNVTYIVSECPDIEIFGDYQRLMQVMSNLISNATKFSEKNSQVKVSTTRSGNIIRVAIIDQGRGIPSAFREHIFEKFSQADPTDTRQQSGTGLGLSIAKEIITAHKGTIGFEDNPEKGTTFYFELPIYKN